MKSGLNLTMTLTTKNCPGGIGVQWSNYLDIYIDFCIIKCHKRDHSVAHKNSSSVHNITDYDGLKFETL